MQAINTQQVESNFQLYRTTMFVYGMRGVTPKIARYMHEGRAMVRNNLIEKENNEKKINLIPCVIYTKK